MICSTRCAVLRSHPTTLLVFLAAMTNRMHCKFMLGRKKPSKKEHEARMRPYSYSIHTRLYYLEGPQLWPPLSSVPSCAAYFVHLNLSLSIVLAAFCWPSTSRRDQTYTARTIAHRDVRHPPFLSPIRTLADILYYQVLNALAPLPLPAALSYLFDIPSFR